MSILQHYTSVTLYLKYIHFCAIIYLCDFFTRITLTSVWFVFVFFPPELYLPLCKLIIFQLFSVKNINLYDIWLKWCFLRLKMSSSRKIYTSVWVFFNYFASWLKWYFYIWRLPLCELTIMVFTTLTHVFYLKNIHLSEMMFSTLKSPPKKRRY